MFFMHQLQLLQERLVLDTHDYCDEKPFDTCAHRIESAVIDVNDWEPNASLRQETLFTACRVPRALTKGTFFRGRALARAKIFPQTFTSNYLYQISEAPLTRAVGNLRTYADLILNNLSICEKKPRFVRPYFWYRLTCRINTWDFSRVSRKQQALPLWVYRSLLGLCL